MTAASPHTNRPAMIGEICRSVNERIREVELGWAGAHDFVCECEDDRCTEVMRMGADEYESLRSDASRFAVLPGHEEVGSAEILARTDRYVVVRKARSIEVIEDVAR